MITLAECAGFCGLTEKEVLAIAEHEHLPENTCCLRSTAPKGFAT
jgi:hypothetical protein